MMLLTREIGSSQIVHGAIGIHGMLWMIWAVTWYRSICDLKLALPGPPCIACHVPTKRRQKPQPVRAYTHSAIETVASLAGWCLYRADLQVLPAGELAGKTSRACCMRNYVSSSSRPAALNAGIKPNSAGEGDAVKFQSLFIRG